ncbi:MAG: class I SAM-dependent methyltransferase [Flavobacterium sp.]|nr:class I SAM-dependent methyltransferase [Flavobacterium sp.]
MDSYKETFETWNKVAQIYEDKFMSLDLYNETYDTFCDLITVENPTVLELGCGPGNITRYVAKKRPDFKIEAIDVAANMIELARKNCPTVDFSILDVRTIDTIKKKYDAIICGFCIPYLSQSDLTKLVADCHQLLNDKGLLYLSFVDGDYADSGYQSGSSGDRTYFYYHSIRDITTELEKYNFTLKQITPVLYSKNNKDQEVHTIIIAQK